MEDVGRGEVCEVWVRELNFILMNIPFILAVQRNLCLMLFMFHCYMFLGTFRIFD